MVSSDEVAVRPRGRWRRSAHHAGGLSVVRRPAVVADPYRHIVFPNNVREVRIATGHLKLLPFSAHLPDIAYIRLSKIERGEVVPRAAELKRIATALDVPPLRLLLDVASPDFDMAAWSAPFAEGAVADDPEEARLALLLAAAVRRARAADPRLSATAISDAFGLAPVILSRIENAHKGLARWSPDIIANVGRLLGDRDERALRSWLDELDAAGELEPFLAEIIGPEDRIERTRRHVAALAIDLDRPTPARSVVTSPVAVSPPGPVLAANDGIGRLALFGAAETDGGITLLPTGETVAAAVGAGPRAYAVRIARATLGPGLPAGSVLAVDPDRHPHAGGLALVRDGEHHRLVAVTADRTGALIGHSLYPEREIGLDGLDAGAVAGVVAAFFA